MTTTLIPSLASADEVLALVNAGTVTSADGAMFLAERFARKTRDGKSITGRALTVFADMMGLSTDSSGGFNAWRDSVLAVAIPLRGGPLPPKAAPAPKAPAKSAKTTAKSAPAKGRGRVKRTNAKAKTVDADAPFTPAQEAALMRMMTLALRGK
jgi:hypothetical protein